jgi:Na+-driven multidrug efflux pump
MGVTGAAWATVIAQALAVGYFLWLILASRGNTLLRARWPFRLDWAMQGRILRIGVPSGVQFMLAAVSLALTYRAVRPFGAEVSAAVGVGFRILQAALFPAIAIGAAAASVAGQSTGARLAARVRETLAWAAAMAAGITLALWLVLVAAPEFWMRGFADEPGILAAGASYLTYAGFANVLFGFGVVVTFCSQAMGRTMLPTLAVAVRVAVYAAALTALGRWLGSTPERVFLCFAGTVAVEAGVLVWIYRDLARITRGWGKGRTTGSYEVALKER